MTRDSGAGKVTSQGPSSPGWSRPSLSPVNPSPSLSGVPGPPAASLLSLCCRPCPCGCFLPSASSVLALAQPDPRPVLPLAVPGKRQGSGSAWSNRARRKARGTRADCLVGLPHPHPFIQTTSEAWPIFLILHNGDLLLLHCFPQAFKDLLVFK